MRIGLISDTHIPEVEKALPPQVMEAFRDVDLILHAGDIYITSVLDELENIAPVLAARGDDDYGNVVADKRVKEKHILNLDGQTLWLIHEKRDFDIFTYQVSKNYQEQDRQNPPDIVVFGHYHHTFVQHDRGVLLVNPGSPTFLNYRRGLGTVAILNIESGEADVHIVQL